MLRYVPSPDYEGIGLRTANVNEKHYYTHLGQQLGRSSEDFFDSKVTILSDVADMAHPAFHGAIDHLNHII